jgi:hypothetical protein
VAHGPPERAAPGGAGPQARAELRRRDLPAPHLRRVVRDVGEKEFYDRGKDPYQIENAHKTAPPELLGRLETRLAALKTCAGDECRKAEDTL